MQHDLPGGPRFPRRGPRLARGQPVGRVRRRCAGCGGPGREHEALRAAAGLGAAPGRRRLDLRGLARRSTAAAAPPSTQQVDLPRGVRARRRARAASDHIGEDLLGPTLIAFGTEEQQRALPAADRARRGAVVPGLLRADAGSDLANVQTRAELRRRRTGSSPARRSGPRCPRSPTGASSSAAPSRARRATTACRTCSCRCGSTASRSGRSSSSPAPREFNEVFFDGARTDAANIVGEARRRAGRSRWPRSAFERGVSTLGQQIGFRRELDGRRRARPRAPARSTTRCCATGWRAPGSGLEIMRLNALRTMAGVAAGAPGPRVLHLQARLGAPGTGSWASWRWTSLGAAGLARRRRAVRPERRWQRLFLFSRSDTIYAGSNEIQRNIIAERVLGLPREPSPSREARR